MAPDQRPPDTLPDPWLFDSEALLNELDRCRDLKGVAAARVTPPTVFDTHCAHFLS